VSHECKESDTCTCYALADEPNGECPVHGAGEWPPRCGECGRFLPWTIRETAVPHVG
jgi:hypothetical protein